MAQANAGKAPKAVEGTRVRKISIKTICGTPDIEDVMKEKEIALMDVFGIASRAKAVTSDYGESMKFIGEFRAINIKTGELFRSSALYLPSALEEDLTAAMGSATDKQAEFGARISVVFDKTAATKYVYLAESLMAPQQSDRMTQLLALVQNRVKELAAPKKS